MKRLMLFFALCLMTLQTRAQTLDIWSMETSDFMFDIYKKAEIASSCKAWTDVEMVEFWSNSADRAKMFPRHYQRVMNDLVGRATKKGQEMYKMDAAVMCRVPIHHMPQLRALSNGTAAFWPGL